MNRLLPKQEDLFPILDDRKTFSETSFTKDFDKLDFISKLQLVNDIVRQTMLIEQNPDPEIEIQELTGDSYTASLISIQYLKELNIGINHKSVFARKRSFDPEDITTMHVITLVEDELGNTYQFDSSPYVGYKIGKVEKTDDYRIYEEYVIIDDSLKEIFYEIRTCLYKLKNNNLSEYELKYFLNILEESKQFSILNGYVSYCYNFISTKLKSNYERKNFQISANELNLYLNNEIQISNRKKLILQQVKKWKYELNELVKDDSNYKRQIELAQSIVQESKIIDPTLEKYLNLDGTKIPYSSISPRLFMEKGLNVVLIKPSSFKLGVQAIAKNSFLKRGNGAIGEYHPNLGLESQLTGLKQMRMFHPHGYKYEYSMTGPSNLFLVKRKAKEILEIKRSIRSEYGKFISNHEVVWFDGNNIIWDPIVTNLVHTTDDPSEASLHYLAGYPEYQLMTRFMYPNPILGKEEKKNVRRI